MAGLLRNDRLLVDRGVGLVARPSLGDLFEHLFLELHGALDRGHQVGQLVVALLEGHVDVGPGALAAPLQGDDVVVAVDDEEYLLPFELIDKANIVPGF